MKQRRPSKRHSHVRRITIGTGNPSQWCAEADEPTAPASCQVGPCLVRPHELRSGLLLQAGLGVTALPRLEVPLTAGAPLVFRELKEPVVSREVCLITRRGRSLPPAGQRLCHQLMSKLVQGPFSQMAGVEVLIDPPIATG